MLVNHFEPKANILIVDEDVIIASDLESLLKGLGYTICGKAANGNKTLNS